VDLPLFENDLDHPGIIEARMLHRPEAALPATAVLCYFNEVLAQLAREGTLRQVYELRSEIGLNPVYELQTESGPLAVVHPGVGAPMAAWITEELIALGATSLLACGGAGALVDDLALGHVMVVSSALRDEGTSFHYAPASRVIEADPLGVSVVEGVLEAHGVPHFVGRTWTTDAFMRETRPRIERRVREGCVMVDMESAAFIAVTSYRKVRFAQLLYAGDALAGPEWDPRQWDRVRSVRERLFHLAAHAAEVLSRA
jgi:uridine phosphorylase